MKVKRVFENQDVVVVDKSPGVVVNRADSVNEETLQDYFAKILDSDSSDDKQFASRSGMVHRLDKNTSGVMIWAKNPETMRYLMKQFKERQVEKEYLALVHGMLEPKEGEIALPLGRARQSMRFGVVVGGKMSQTRFEVLESFESKNSRYQDGFSLVRLAPKTGRTHQLRVVMQHLGHTLVGDRQYLSKKRWKADKKWCSRVFLHAHKLRLAISTKKLDKREFESQLADDLRQSLELIKEQR